jgi:HSP20 family molecular chaperone IbpA
MTNTGLEPLRGLSALTTLEHEMERFMDGPVAVKRDTITASLTNGVLHIRLPKAEEAKSNCVNVEVK